MKILKNISLRMKRGIVITSIAITSVFSVGFVDSYFELSKNLDIFATLLRELNTYYVDDIKPGELIKKGIDEMLTTLDPYTQFYAETDIEDYRMMVTGQYGGIGAIIRQKGDHVIVGEPYEGFPAYKAGLMSGDIILEIDGKDIKGKTTSEVSKLLKGQANTTVKVLIERGNKDKPFEVMLTREEVKIRNVPYYGMLDDKTGYIKLSGFTQKAASEVKSAYQELKKNNAGMSSLVFDLRDNGGGLLKESVDIVNAFVSKDQIIVQQKGKVKEMNRTHKSTATPMDTIMPIVVLVNKNSASASEIVSGSLQDLDRGVVIGQRTFGKGLVQQTIKLSYGTQMKVTTAKYYTPSGRCIQEMDYFHKSKDGSAMNVPDSLIREFKTRGGRSVYDGSGIYPDITIDKRTFAQITGAINAKNYIFDYATKFRLSNESIPKARDFSLTDEQFEDFVNYLSDKTYDYTTQTEKSVETLKTDAEKEKYFDDIKDQYESLKKEVEAHKKLDLKKHKAEIKEVLEAEIASRYYYQAGRLESYLRHDQEVKEALKILYDKELYASILSGKGEYKVIGKPGDVQAKAETDESPEEE